MIRPEARNLKQYTSPIFMSRMLSPEDHEKEKLVVKKRRELINQGTPAKELKIKNLKLLHNNTEVQLWLSSNHLSVLLYNCQSLISIQRRLKLADYLNIHQPAIVCLPETWLSDCHFDVNVLPNCSYGIISQSMRKSGQHGGVLIATNNTVAIRYAEVSMLDCDFACATLLNSDAGFWLLIAIYNPPRDSSYCLEPNVITGCINHFVSTARGIILSDAPMKLVIVGDFNLPDVNWETYFGSSEYSQTILNYLDSHNLIQNVMEPTHRSGNILDLVFAADDTAVTVANVNLISDHYPITFDLVLELPIIKGSSSVSVYSKSSFNELCFWWNLSFLHSYCVWRNPKEITVGDWYCLFNYALMSSISLKR